MEVHIVPAAIPAMAVVEEPEVRVVQVVLLATVVATLLRQAIRADRYLEVQVALLHTPQMVGAAATAVAAMGHQEVQEEQAAYPPAVEGVEAMAAAAAAVEMVMQALLGEAAEPMVVILDGEVLLVEQEVIAEQEPQLKQVEDLEVA